MKRIQGIEHVLILGGYGAERPDRFTVDEENRAKSFGLHVVRPRLPDFNNGGTPLLADFRECIKYTLFKEGMDPEFLAVLGHSLGAVGWEKLLQEILEYRKATSVLVCGARKNNTGFDRINDFFKESEGSHEWTEEERGRILVVGDAEDDPITHELPHVLADELGAKCLAVERLGHAMPGALHPEDDFMDCGPDWMKKVRPLINQLVAERRKQIRRFLPY